MSDYLVFFVADPVDDDLAAAVRKRVRATAGAGWFDDLTPRRPPSAPPAATSAWVRPRTSWARRCCQAARDVSALHGVRVEVQWSEEIVGHIEGGTFDGSVG